MTAEHSRWVGLTRADLPHHSLISGEPGTGKTQLLINLILRAAERKVPVLWIDPKADSEHLHDRIDVVPADHFALNPLAPPSPQVTVADHLQRLVPGFCEPFGLQERSKAILTRALDILYRDFDCYRRWPSWDWRTMRFPGGRTVLGLLESKEFQKQVPPGLGRQALHGVSDRLRRLLTLPMFDCERGIDLVRLYRERRVVSVVVDQLAPEQQGYLSLMLLNNLLELFRAHGPRNECNFLFVVDEAGPLIGAAYRDHQFVKSTFEQLREFGVGVICCVQRPSETTFFPAIAGTKVVFRHGHLADIRAAFSAIGATPEQVAENFSLHPFEALVRTRRLNDIHKIRVPFIPRGNKFVPRQQLLASMRDRLAAHRRDVIPVRPRDTETTRVNKTTRSIQLDERERAFLECAADHPDWPLTRIYQAINLTASSGHQVRTRLEKKGCIRVQRANLGKNRNSMRCTVINPDIVQELGVTLGAGRGRLHHTFWQAAHKTEAETLGWRAWIEGGTGGVGAADVLVAKQGKRGGVEVAVSSKESQEVAHIHTDLSKLKCDFVILTFLSIRKMERTRALAETQYPAEVMRGVRCCLVTEFGKTLGAFG